MKRYVFAVLSLLLCALSSCTMFQVEKVEDIQVVIKKIELQSVDQRQVKLAVTVSIRNPNTYKVVLSRAESDIYVNEIFLAQVISPQALEIDKNASSTIDIYINYRDVISVLDEYNPKDKISCKADGLLYFQLPNTFTKRKVYTKRMIIEKKLPALNDMVKSDFEIGD